VTSVQQVVVFYAAACRAAQTEQPLAAWQGCPAYDDAMSLSAVLGIIGCITGIPSAALSVYNLRKAREEKRRLDVEVAGRKEVEARAVELLRQLPRADSAARAHKTFAEFVLGADPVLDKAVRLAYEWRAVLIRWNEGSYQVRLRGLNEPPDDEQRFGWR
jgi:hypothetical protein